MSRHTKAPWRVEPDPVYEDFKLKLTFKYITGPDRIEIAKTMAQSSQVTNANARLIAASPELYNFVKAVYLEHKELGDSGDAEYLRKCEDLIMKVEGKDGLE